MFRVRECPDFKKIRVGGEGDGAYVMLDNFKGITNAISLGVGPDVDWDYAIAERGIPVDQFDHTVAAPPRQHPLFRFHKTQITGRKQPDTATLESIVTDLKIGEPASALLKIDIENWEWSVFKNASQDVLGRFSQILCEFHAFDNLHQDDHWQRALDGLTNLKEGFDIVHVHCNNVASITFVKGKPIPHVLEVSLVNRSRYRTRPSREKFPTRLDRPNDPTLVDFELGRFGT